MRARYRIDTFQKTYFVIDDFRQLFDIARTGLRVLVAEWADAYGAGDVLPADTVITRGSGEGWRSDGDT